MNGSTYAEMTVDLDVAPGQEAGDIFVRLAHEFHELADTTVRDIAFDASASTVTMCFTFDGVLSAEDAIKRATTLGRTAFHAAGFGTPGPGWDHPAWSIVPHRVRTPTPA